MSDELEVVEEVVVEREYDDKGNVIKEVRRVLKRKEEVRPKREPTPTPTPPVTTTPYVHPMYPRYGEPVVPSKTGPGQQPLPFTEPWYKHVYAGTDGVKQEYITYNGPVNEVQGTWTSEV